MKLDFDGAESNLLQIDKDQERYRCAINGDHLMKVPFKCELCHYRIINKRDPVEGCKKDEDMFIGIQQTQLDVFWSRGPTTVTSNLSRLRRDYIDSTAMFNMGDMVLPYLSSHTVQDRVGIAPTLITLSASTRPGDYCTSVQSETTRKMPACYENAHNA